MQAAALAKPRGSAAFTAQGSPRPALKTVCASATKCSMRVDATSCPRSTNQPPGRSTRATDSRNGCSFSGAMWCRPMKQLTRSALAGGSVSGA
ncbi:hypothetical protein RSP799_20485 [Ralstonia solanacearum]|nr:hypothetical protein RSP799_20485 [Ralstonia solanacearum]